MKPFDKKNVKVRRMVSSDVSPTMEIWWADIPEKEKVASELQGPLDMSFIAEYEGILVGFMLAKRVFTGMPLTEAGVIFLMAVNPDYRKHGIGTMMIEALETHCKAKGINTVRAGIPEKDAEVVKYFQNVGFRKSGVVNYDRVEPSGIDK